MAEVVHIDNIAALKALDRMGEVFARPRPLLDLIVAELRRVKNRCIQQDESPEGIPWRLLSRRYSAWKSKRFPGRGILRLTGQLLRSIHEGTTATSAYISTGLLAHAKVHQYGFDGTVTVPTHMRKLRARGRGRKRRPARTTQVKSHARRMRIPARPYMGFPPDSEQRVIQDIRDLIIEHYEGRE